MGIKITELPSTTVNDADYIPVANTTSGTRKVLMQDVLNNASPPVDSALSLLSENPVQNKAVAAAVNSQAAAIANISDDVDELKSQIDYGSITVDVKEALLQLAQKVAYIDDQGQTYYDDLYDALYNRYWQVTNNLTNCTTSNESVQTIKGAAYSATITASTGYVMTGATVSITMGGNDITATAYSNGVISIPAVTGALVITISAAAKTVSSISAVYTQSGTVYDTDSLDSLKTDLVVTATYSDSSTAVIPAADYTLSGTLAEGTSTITVSYGGKTTTVTVTVTSTVLYSLASAFTSSGSNSVNTGIALEENKQYTITIECSISSFTSSVGFIFSDRKGNASDYIALQEQVSSSNRYLWGSGFGWGASKNFANTNQTIRFVLTIDTTGTTSRTYYIKNVSASTSQTGTSTQNSLSGNTIYLGQEENGSGNGFNGTVANFTIHQRILSADEINAYLDGD